VLSVGCAEIHEIRLFTEKMRIPLLACFDDLRERDATGGLKLLALHGRMSSQILERDSDVYGQRAGGFGS
jgi:hypothetical protein